MLPYYGAVGRALPIAASVVALVVSAPVVFSPVAASADDHGYRAEYRVRRGDTLGKIARRLSVTIRQLKRWNRIRGSRIRAGQKLIYYTATPPRPSRIIRYRIQRGDTLAKIARRFHTTVRALRTTNRLRRRSRIIAGRTLKVEVLGPENPSKSIGRPQRGSLENGERLIDGPGWTLMKPYVWGANSTITHLMTCIPRVRQKWRRAPDVVIGDLSRRGGGFLAPHRSHQNGLDVDIGYYHKGREAPTRFRPATPRTIDVVKTWYLLKCFLDTGDVDLVFIDYALQKPLFDYARRHGARRAWLTEHFQYPRGSGTARGVIRHSPSHVNHLHIRFKSPHQSEEDSG